MSPVSLSPLIACALSTFGVSALVLTPHSAEPVMGVFDASAEPADIWQAVLGEGLDVVSFDDQARHIIVSNSNGEAFKRLKRAGASLVFDARLASLCNSKDTPFGDQLS